MKWLLFLTRSKLVRTIVFLSLPTVLLLVAFWKPDYQPPIFDAQVHYNQESWRRVSVQAVINTAHELNVPWLLVASLPNEGTWRLKESDSVHIIPMLVPYHQREDRETWFNDVSIQRYIEKEITTKPYRGIGEFHLFDGQVDTAVVRHMVKLAFKNNLILHARSDPNALRQLFSFEPHVKILWAHAGMLTPTETIDEMLTEYPRLWIEISHRGDVAPQGKLSPAWRDLILNYPNRILLGSGTYNSKYWYQFRYILNHYRQWLKQIPPEIAQKIAYRNGLELFELDPSNIAIETVVSLQEH